MNCPLLFADAETEMNITILAIIVLVLLVSYSNCYYALLQQDFNCSVNDKWLIINYSHILKQSHYLLVLVEQYPYDELIFSYIQLLMQHINKDISIPVTIYEMQNCNQEYLLAKSDIIMVIATSKKTLMELFQAANTCFPEWDNRSHFIIMILHNLPIGEEDKENDLALSISEELWVTYKALNFLIVTRNLKLSCMIRTTDVQRVNLWLYNPFELKQESSLRGNIHRFGCGQNVWYEYAVKRFVNLHGYPLHISIFSQYPTAISRCKSNNNCSMYRGMDGIMLSSLEQHLNVSTVYHSPLPTDLYGSVLPNSSIVGSLGDVVSGKTNISFNSRFIKYYGTDDIEFSVPITTDKMCFLIPKAKLIPKWKSMLMCFGPITWCTLLLSYIASSACFCLFQMLHRPGSTSSGSPILNTFQVFILSPVNHPPKLMTERLLFSICLFSSLILMNAFQGLLLSSVTSPIYQPDINTIDELFDADIPILSKSFQTRDLFINAGHKISNKFVLFTRDTDDFFSFLIKSHSAVTERESTIVFLVTKYVLADGTQLLHKVSECPIFYHLAYIFPKGSPFLPRFDYFLKQVIESGLRDKWYWDDIDIKTKLSYKKNQQKQNKHKSFTLSDLQLPFYVLGIGLTLSLMAFISELIKGRLVPHHFKNIN